MIFARKMPEFYIMIARKIFLPNFRGHVPSLPRLLRLYGLFSRLAYIANTATEQPAIMQLNVISANGQKMRTQ